MKDHDTIFRYIGITAIVLLLFGLAGWYFFISGRTADLEGAAQARGFDIGIPSFSGSRGSTAENIAVGFGTPLTGEAAVPASGTKRAPRLWRVNSSPVAGAGFVSSGSTTILRFIERSTGHIFDADPETGTVVRRTNKLIPRVYEAMVGNGDSVIERSLDDKGVLSTFSGTLGTTTVDGFVPLTGVDLGSEVRDIAISGVPDAVFLASRSGMTFLIRSMLGGEKPKEIISLAGGDFNLALVHDGRMILTERAASGIPSNSYEAQSGTLVPLVRNVPGLTLLAHASSSAVLIGSDDGQSLSLSLRSSKDASAVSLPIRTTADKCAWAPGTSLTAYCAVPQESPGPGFLTNWYRGTVHTTDSWFEVDGAAGTATAFFSMDAESITDVEHPSVDDTGNYLAFMNARDKSLWILRITE